jgi:DNA polymerase-3 subunit epsilon
VVIARRAWPELIGNGGHGLASLKQFLGLEFNHHDAEEDARAAAMVVLLAEEHTGQSFKALSDVRHHARSYPAQIKMAGDASGPLFGQVAVFTGRLSIARSEAARLAASAGITIKTSVSKKITLVVVGDQDLGLLAPGETKSTKHRRAEELIDEGCDIRIIGESEFRMLVEESKS